LRPFAAFLKQVGNRTCSVGGYITGLNDTIVMEIAFLKLAFIVRIWYVRRVKKLNGVVGCCLWKVPDTL